MGTTRHQIMECLSEKAMSAIELSQELGIREKDVYEHLPHIARSVSTQRKRLVIHPAQCLSCGYLLKNGDVSLAPVAVRCVREHIFKDRLMRSIR